MLLLCRAMGSCGLRCSELKRKEIHAAVADDDINDDYRICYNSDGGGHTFGKVCPPLSP